ncbi:MAG: GtrA family protein [Pseudomonadota bacterium]
MIKTIRRHFFQKQFMGFLLVCGFAAIVNFGSRIILGVWMSYATSIIIAYILGIITAYFLCRLFVFKQSRNTPYKQIFYFILVNIFAILQTLLVSVILAYWIFAYFIKNQFLREEIAHFIGICVPAFTSYIGHKYLSFK